MVASDDSKAALRRLLATSDVILQPRKPFLTHFDVILKLLGPPKTYEFLKENQDFHFCVLSAPDPASEPQKMTQKRRK